jgi:putative transposase
MRRARVRVPEDQAPGVYHCLSRVVDRRFVLGDTEKEHFVALMRECEAFCEVRVLTFCLMSNHFHILLEVPPRPVQLPSAREILAKLRRLTGHQDVGAVEQRLAMYRAAGDEAGLAAYLATFHARMWDLSQYMKLLKQRFSQWYNRRMERSGTLWEERFKSVVVEAQGVGLRAVAAYIDLNPVRAGLVKDPKVYRWSGYGEAMAGKGRAREGLRRVVAGEGLEAYRVYLYLEGSEEREARDERGRAARGALGQQAVLKVLAQRGQLPLREYVRCRVRYFCDGVVLGSRGFVEEMFGRYRPRFGEKRRTGARVMRGLAGEELCTWRDLRADVFG